MRQYRGLTKEGKWVYGWYQRTDPSTPDKIKHYIIDCFGITSTALVLAHTISDLPGYYEVIPESVGQFTGRKDKHKAELYQDDIVRKHHKNYRIVWNDKGFWELQRPSDWWLALYKVDSEKLERIGNIHQNSALLEQGNGS